MALPAIVGIPALVQFLIKILEWIVAKFAARVTTRLATSLAWVTFYLGLLVALAATFSAIIAGISMAMPADLARGVSLIKPRNLEACIGAIYAAKVAMWVFQQKKQLMDWEQMRRFI